MLIPMRERALEGALTRLYKAWADLPVPPGKNRPYYANYIRQMFTPGCVRYRGGVGAVRHVIHKRRTSGLDRLKDYPKLTVDWLVVSGEWDDLFDEADRNAARKHLTAISR
jgi:hypothetical protein